MLILGIESSCDDTAAAVVENGTAVRSSVVSSQDALHAKYGGVVPEIASRSHIETIVPVVQEALCRAGAGIADIDAVAVTQGPGLVGSILVGLSFAKSVAYARNIPLTPVNHIEAHSHAAFLVDAGDSEKGVPRFPFVSLIVSGGHTTLLLMESPAKYRILGQTIDDAAGEAFDKVAKLLGLGYPGGAAIDQTAKSGSPAAVNFTRPYMAKGNLDFSFSGLKTAVLTHVRSIGELCLSRAVVSDIAASFQESVVDVLAAKAFWALSYVGASDLVVAGGVACNSRLRARLQNEAGDRGIRLFIPPPKYCSDNGAMIAALGYHQIKDGVIAGLDLNAKPTWEGF